MENSFAPLVSRIRTVSTRHIVGRVTAIMPQAIRATGIEAVAEIGDRVSMGPAHLLGEVLAIDETGLTIMPEGGGDGVRLGDSLRHLGPRRIAPSDAWIGRVIDPDGVPLDGRPLFPGPRAVPLHAAPPPPATRRPFGARLATGLAVLDTALPIVRGQRLGLFAGSGVGKSSLLGRLARNLEADITVIALIGERGRELRDFVEDVLGPEGMARSVVVAATSDQPALRRVRAATTAMSIAEYFRDQGAHIVFLADSITRFAEAYREVALSLGEGAQMRGYPPSMAQAIMRLCERAGPGPRTGRGDITAVFSVLVAGSDMEEPVADLLRGVLDGHIVLDRAIAERGRFPAIDLLRSVSRALPHCASAEENGDLADLRANLAGYQRIEMMVQAGLYSEGGDPDADRALRLFPILDRFLAASSDGPDAAFAMLRGHLSENPTVADHDPVA